MKLNKLSSLNKQLVISEIGQSHDGSLNYVHSFIDEAAKSGVDIIKFQAHYADEESTKDDTFRTFTTHKKETRYQYWKRMEFTKEEWSNIYKHTKKRKMLFSSSVFSSKSINIMKKVGIEISSGESLNLNLVKEITKISTKPVFISTGMSYQNEIDSISNFMKKKKNEFLLMHCTSEYPCNDKNIGINILNDYLKRYKCPIGYSDHSGGIEVPLLALQYNISAIEVHVMFDKKIFNPDASSSIDFTELKFLTSYLKKKTSILSSRRSKNSITDKLKKNRKLFSKSLALKNDMKKNQSVKFEDLTFKKPGTGLKVLDLKRIIGKKLLKNKSKTRLLKLSDVK
jgi:N-acetylneuraminate synthase